MNHARNDVLPRATFPLDEYRNIGAGQFDKTIADGEHAFGVPENDSLGRHFSQRLYERVDSAGCHGWFLPGGDLQLASQEPNGSGRIADAQL